MAREKSEKGKKSTKIMMHFEQSVLFADKSRIAHSQNRRLLSAICLHFHFNETSFAVLANGIITLFSCGCVCASDVDSSPVDTLSSALTLCIFLLMVRRSIGTYNFERFSSGSFVSCYC